MVPGVMRRERARQNAVGWLGSAAEADARAHQTEAG